MLFREEFVPESYRTEFVAKVKEISTLLGINPNWLMQIMYWESGQSFSASVQNPTSKATGLIQFMPETAEWLGTSITELAQMTAVKQLDYVYEYYRRYKSKLKSYTDLYLTTFYPAAVGKSSSYVLGSSASRIAAIATQNPSFDNNKDGAITKGEIEEDMLAKIPSDWKHEFITKVLPVGLVLMITAVAGLSYYLINNAGNIS